MSLVKKISGLYNRILWNRTKRKLKSVGSGSFVGTGFTIKGAEYITIGDNFKTGKNITIHTWKSYHDEISRKDPELIIGSNVSMTKNSYISCADKIFIGDGVLIGEGCFIADNSHGKNTADEIEIPPALRPLYTKGEVIIGKNVWLGRNVCIMPGVKIGDYAIVGANSVVTHDVPEKTIVGGVPARVIKSID